VRRILALISFFGLMAVGAPGSAQSPQVSRTEPRLCDAGVLPAGVQNRLKADFGGWKLQEPENLSHQARLSWAGKKIPACPGVAAGFFRSPKQTAYAVLLVPSGHPDTAYTFVVFAPQPGDSEYEELVVEKSDQRGASNFYVQQVPVSKFFDETSKKKFQVQATEAVLMVDSAENEYEAEIYFWSNGRFRQEPVDY
jgi:hypothetical protein